MKTAEPESQGNLLSVMFGRQPYLHLDLVNNPCLEMMLRGGLGEVNAL